MAYTKAKSEHAFRTFSRDLKDKDFPPVLFMYGEEEYLIQWACKSLADKFVDKAMADFDFVRMGEEDITAESLLEACDTLSVFSERRVLWAHNFPPLIKKNSRGFGEKEIEKITDYITSPNQDAILIFSCVNPDDGSGLVKFLKKNSRCYSFGRLDMTQLAAFAEKRFKAAGTQIDKATLRYFIDETGYFNREGDYRILNLESDIKKLVAHCHKGVVTREDVDETLHGDLGRFAFNFLDAIGNNRKDIALRLLHNVLTSGGEVFSLLGLLVNQFELMLEANELRNRGLSQEQIASELKVNPYRVKKAMAVSNRFGEKKLREILSQLYEIDRNIKTGMMEQTLALELLIGRI